MLTNFLRKQPQASWGALKSGLKTRFSNQHLADEALVRFLSDKEVFTFEELMTLLRDERILKEKKGISVENLMRQIVARVSSRIKSILMQAAFDEVTWEQFLGTAERSA